MPEVLHVQKRSSRGKKNSRRLRRSGQVPAVLYGHKEESLSLTLGRDELDTALRHGSKLCELQGDVSQTALFQALQWDPFGTEVLHVDLMRVKADELVELQVTVEMRGEAPGVKESGVVKQPIHEVTIKTTATSIPEKLHVNVNHLELNDVLTIKDIEDLPDGAQVLEDPGTVLVQCVPQLADLEEEAGEAETAEPEIIGKKAEEEAGEASE